MAMEHFKEMPDGKVVDLWSYGTPNDSASDFQEITYEDSWKDFKFYMHGAHAMIYALSDTILWGKYKTHANIMVGFLILVIFQFLCHICILQLIFSCLVVQTLATVF